MKRLNIKLDPETHRLLKRLAAEQETTIQALVVQIINDRVYHAVTAQ